MEPILGQIILFAGNFVPIGFALCNGELLSIAQNTALFSLVGAIYGGDGKTTFGLPNLKSPANADGSDAQPYGIYLIAVQGVYPTRA